MKRFIVQFVIPPTKPRKISAAVKPIAALRWMERSRKGVTIIGIAPDSPGAASFDGREQQRLIDDRFCDVLVEPGGEIPLAVSRHCVRSECYHGQVSQLGIGANVLQHREAIHARKRNVEQHHIRRAAAQSIERSCASLVLGDLMIVSEQRLKEQAIVGVVLDDGDVCHRCYAFARVDAASHCRNASSSLAISSSTDISDPVFASSASCSASAQSFSRATAPNCPALDFIECVAFPAVATSPTDNAARASASRCGISRANISLMSRTSVSPPQRFSRSSASIAALSLAIVPSVNADEPVLISTSRTSA